MIEHTPNKISKETRRRASPFARSLHITIINKYNNLINNRDKGEGKN